MTGRPPARDKCAEFLQLAVQSACERGERERGAAAINDLPNRIRTVEPVGQLTGKPAYDLLVNWLLEAEKYSHDTLAETWSPYRWLWYLRRIGDGPFGGRLPTTQRYDRTLTEALCMSGALPPEPLTTLYEAKDGQVSVGYPISEDVAARVAFACGVGRATSHLHSCLRSASKGAAVELRPGVGPIVQQSAEWEASITNYDERAAADSSPEAYFGTFMDLLGRPGAGAALLFFRSQEPYTFNFADRLPHYPNLPDVEVAHVPQLLHLEQAADILEQTALSDPQLWHRDLPNLIALLHLCALLVVRRGPFLLKAMVNGYDLIQTKRLIDLFDEARGPLLVPALARMAGLASGLAVDGQCFLASLREMEACAWPILAGPVVVNATSDQIALNVAAASDRLVRLLQLPNIDGEAANVRSSAFESSVQKRIDRTPWKPPDHLHALVRRQLRRHQQRIGEVDAIAHREGTTLLISCKARLYTPGYDAGVYNEIRNTASALRNDLDAWKQFVASLDEARHGDNYDLRTAGRLVGVVVTPHVMYVDPDRMHILALPGLHSCSSAGELVRWLVG